jgi:5-dehydro-4-deoxyglucarate dehydratase
VIVFSPTPFTAADEIDLDGLGRHVDALSGIGLSCVVVCGGVGEFYALDAKEHGLVVKTAVEAAAGRVAVVAGVGHSTRTACQLARQAMAAGADGLMINPLYFVETTAEGIRLHFEAIGKSSGAGCIVYRCPSLPYDLETLLALADIETVIAVKDEIGDLEAFLAARSLIGDRFTWINGMAELLANPYAAAGATAMTSGVANFAPALSLAIWRAATELRNDEVDRLNATYVRPIAALRRRRAGYATTVIKEAMNLLGLPGGRVRLPLVPLVESERDELSRALDRLPQTFGAVTDERDGREEARCSSAT